MFLGSVATGWRPAVIGWIAAALLCPLGPADAQPQSLRKLADVATGSINDIPKHIGLEVSPAGALVAGYVANVPGSGGGPVELVGFTPGQVDPTRTTLDDPAANFGFGIDAFGQLSYIAAGVSPFRVGNAVDGWPASVDPFIESFFPAGGPNFTTFPFSYELDANGLPAIASLAANLQPGPSQRYVWRFNPQTAGWDRTDLPLTMFSGTAGAFAPQSIAFTPDSRLVHATIDNVGSGQRALSVLVEDPDFGFRELAGLTNVNPTAGVSVAASDTGEVAFAFNLSVDLVQVGIFDGDSTAYETIDFGATTLGQRSLAYDDTGNLALVHTEGGSSTGLTPRPLVLSRRAADGTWTDTPLGIDAFYGELAFGDNGEIYIGAVIEDAVVLLSDNIDPLRGDMNFDEAVDLDDVLAFVQAIESPAGYADQFGFGPVFKGDLNEDGLFNLADVEPFVDALGLTGPAAAALTNLVPEPSATLLLAAGVAGLMHRRQHKGGSSGH